ncbi:MAG: sigma-54-dependent Fis family transcriptional regulator [Polyangiaceae bacterium]|nr:sigma-54-dependent Fis family transcriptional regulator [Polyangiaceae bacterium]
MVASRGQLLVASGDASERRALARVLLAAGFQVLTAPDLEGVHAALRTSALDVVCVALGLVAEPQALERLRDADPRVPVAIAAPSEALARAAALARTAAGFVVQMPVEAPEVMVASFERAVAERALRAERAAHRDVDGLSRGELLLASGLVARLARQLVAFAELDAAVALSGEPGTGKRTFARLLCEHGRRAAGPVRVCDAGAVDPAVLEGELFDADTGLLRRAIGGTLVVVGLERLPLPLQQRLHLRLWPEGLGVSRSAGGGEAAADVRLCALTDEPVRKLSAEHRLHAPLAVRLALRLELPPLRRRRDEIALFAYHFLRRHAPRLGRTIRRIGTETLRRLRARDWPGNLAELEQVVVAAVAACQGEVLLPRDLEGLAERVPESGAGDWAELADLPYRTAKVRAVQDFDAAYVRHLLAATGGRRREAARRAGLDPANFRRLCHRVGAAAPAAQEPPNCVLPPARRK